MKSGARGVTLMELLMAGTIASVAVIGIHSVLNSTFAIQRQMQRQANSFGQNIVALAMIRVAQEFEIADRYIISPSGDDIQLRIPPRVPPSAASELDNPAAYRWDQFKYDGASKSLLFYSAGDCSNPETLAQEVDLVSFSYVTEDWEVPPGGDCFASGNDCNFISYQVRWNNGLAAPAGKTQEFRGLVASRNISDSNVDPAATVGGSDSGNQLFAAPGPPGDC